GRLDAVHGVDEVNGPGVGHDDAAEDDEEERHAAPESGGVVPVEVAGLGGEAAAEPGDGSHAFPTPFAREPEDEAADDDEEEGEVGGSGDGSASVARVLRHREPAVPVFN